MATVHEICDSLGLTAETIRHYREIGLLSPKVRRNGYYDYSVADALTALLSRELRSYDLSLTQARDAFATASMGDYLEMLESRSIILDRQMKLLQLEMNRMSETLVYASCGVRILGGVEEFDGPATWAVGALSKKDGLRQGRGDIMRSWLDHLPFTYVSVTIPLEELGKRGEGAYALEIGAGALCHYVDEFSIPLTDDAHFQPGGHFIRTCIAVEEVMEIGPSDLARLYDYAEDHGYVFSSCTGGRLLFIENSTSKPIFYMLIWVGVKKKGA